MRGMDRLLFACSRQELGPEHRQAISEVCSRSAVSWEVVAATAEAHKVAPLVGMHLLENGARELGMPPEIEERFELRRSQNRVCKERLARRVAAALDWFNARSVDVMLLKGAALDVQVYRQSWLTGPSDADLVLSCRKGSQVFEESRPFIRSIYRNWIECDSFDHHDVTMNGILPIDFERIWRDARRIDYRGRKAFVMSPEDQLLSLCITSCRKRFFRLKSLCDIAESIRRWPDLDWDELVRRAWEGECENIVYTALLVTQATVGCALPPEILRRLAVHPARALILRWLARGSIHAGSLTSLAPTAGRIWHGKRLSPSLLLPYASYRGSQAWRSVRRSHSAPEATQVEAAAPPTKSRLYWHAASPLDYTNLPRRTLGGTGVEVSEIGLCCGPGGDPAQGDAGSERRLLAGLWRGVEMGVNHFDLHRCPWEGPERALGKLLQGVPRDEVVLAAELASPRQAGEDLRPHIERKLARLATDYIDLCYVPVSGEPTEDLDRTAEIVLRLQEEGKIRVVGLRAEAPDVDESLLLRMASALRPAILQIPLGLNGAAQATAAWAESRGLGIVVRGASPLEGHSGDRAADLVRREVRHWLARSPSACIVLGFDGPAQVDTNLGSAGHRLTEEG